MSWTYRPALDGLRSVAVYLVVLFHAGVAAAGGGFIGVDLFFVLSGFLVSNVILSEIDARGRLDLGKFYARRVRRLLPAAVVVVVATSFMFLLVTSVVRRLPLVHDAQSALLYVANWRFLLQQNDYFATDVEESPFLHFWSLAIEEQFYFVFPVVLMLLVRAARTRRWVLPGVVAGLFVASLAAQLYWAQVDVSWAYYGTDARLYQLLGGILVTLLLRGTTRRPSAAVAGAGALVGLAGLLLLGSGLLELTPSTRGIGATAASMLLVAGLMTSEHGLLSKALSRRTPVYLGQISYGTYLWHWPVILLIEEVLAVRPLVLAVLAIVLSSGLAALSFQVLEHPLRTAASLRRFRWTTAVVGVATSALVAATLVPALLESERKPRLVAGAAANTPAKPVGKSGGGVTLADRTAPVPDIDWASLEGGGDGPQPQCTPDDPDACTIVEGGGPHVLLVGDSHAGMLVPMFEKLAEEHDLTLSVNTVPACTWQAGVENHRQPDRDIAACTEAREAWYDEVLPKVDPDLVVLSTRSRDEVGFWGKRLVRAGGSDEPLPELMRSTTLETVGRFTEVGARVLMVDSLPVAETDPLECLATATKLYECEVAVPRKAPASDTYYAQAAARSEDVFTVNLNDVFCVGLPRCLPVVDGIVVWHDNAHFSRQLLLDRREQAWKKITATGALDGIRPGV